MPSVSVRRRPSPRLPGSARAHDTLLAACCELLRLLKIPHFRVNQKPHRQADGSYRNQGADAGAADLIGCLPGGIVLYVEIKSGHAGLRPAQRIAHDQWKAAGASVLIARDVMDLWRHLAENCAQVFGR